MNNEEKNILFDYIENRHVMILIDAANLENSVKDLGWWVDYKRLFELFKKYSAKLLDIRYYCAHFGNEKQDNFLTFLKHAGLTFVLKPIKLIRTADGNIHKANFDVEITIDALDKKDSYDTLVLFSGDSDFSALVHYLKGKNKKVIVISTKKHVSKELVKSANKFIDLKKLKFFIKRER